jgi:hypothetical protein
VFTWLPSCGTPIARPGGRRERHNCIYARRSDSRMRCSTSEIIKKGNHFEELPPCAQATITIAHNLSFIDKNSEENS